MVGSKIGRSVFTEDISLEGVFFAEGDSREGGSFHERGYRVVHGLIIKEGAIFS